MTPHSTAESPLNITLPSGWSNAAMALLEPDEQVLAWLEPDLDDKLYFATGAIVLTAQCLVMDISAGTVLYINNVSGTSSDNLANAANVVVTLTNGTATANDLSFKSGKFSYEGVVIRPTPVS
jgi:hypothetical protein